MTQNKTNKVSNVPPLRFKGYTAEWARMKVSDLLDFYPTNSLSWEQLDYDVEDIQNLHYGLIHVGLPTLIDLSTNQLPGIKPDNMPKHYELCKEGDVAFADASEDTNEVAKVVELYNLGNKQAVCGLHTIHGRDNHNRTIKGFKGYALSSCSFHLQIRRLAQGTKIYSISTKNFAESYISIPSKEEQERIVSLLYLIDQRIATQNKIIQHLESLITGITQSVRDNATQKVLLRDVLTEKDEKNIGNHDVYSVSVSEGVINQIDYLGRSFAAKETRNYNVVQYGDIVYTKSPTGSFPYGIVKQSYIKEKAAVSPLYGVYKPVSFEVGYYLHHYFTSPIYTTNYLHKLIQKGAKNTINITNQRFLENYIPLPSPEVLEKYVALVSAVTTKLENEKQVLNKLKEQKNYLLSKMFI